TDKRRSAKAVSLPSKAASPCLSTFLWCDNYKAKHSVQTLLDTGAEENFISFKVVDRLQQNQSIRSSSVPISLELADGSNLDLQKKVKLKAEFPELPGRKALCFAFSAYVMPMRSSSSHDLVVGFPLIQELDLFGYMRTHPSLQHKTIEDVSWELEELDHRRFIRKDELCTYHEVHISCEFQDELTEVLSELLGKVAVEGGKKIPPMNIELKEGADFTLRSNRRIPRAYRDFLEKEIQDLLKARTIQRSSSCCDTFIKIKIDANYLFLEPVRNTAGRHLSPGTVYYIIPPQNQSGTPLSRSPSPQ
ncbi:hypothetical protein ADUPG1_007316, partial [Aduncisulcus paluster]